jgi:type I restriction enzyme S subunit
MVTEEAIGSGTRLAPAGSSLILVRGMSLLEEIRVNYVPRPVAFNQDVKALVPRADLEPWFLTYLLLANRDRLLASVHQAGHGTGVLATERLAALAIVLPPIDEQRRIAGVLGALDELIESNVRLHDQLLEQAFAIFTARTEQAELVALRDLGVEASRGVTPNYDTGSDSVMVLNQKCIRGSRVDLRVARRMAPRSVRPEKMAKPGDTLVNSTGTGTLGRASRWMGPDAIHVDSHVTVVKAESADESAYVAYTLISRTDMIESLAEGSTGQTELSRDRLLGLQVPNLVRADRVKLGRSLDELDKGRAQLLSEAEQLRRVRDELLPLLMSGRVRVKYGEVAA